jgi:2-dehydro-3-deoxyphosphogalactonate aldolase
MTNRLGAAMARLPLIAILRGIKPAEAAGIGHELVAHGFGIIEVPLNSLEPLASIEALRFALPQEVVIGAGTVLRAEDVRAVKAAGGELIVMPHADLAVITAAKAEGLGVAPGVATPTEAFAALGAGADALKLFPAELITPAAVKAMLAVLPKDTVTVPVGGITPQTLRPYVEAGARGFGLGSALYKPGMTAAEVGTRAEAFASAWRSLGTITNG